MKCLTVLRHAKSSWDDPHGEDFGRPLNDRGRRAAEWIGREFEQRHFVFDLVLASPAVRVRQTIEHVQRAFKFAAAVRFDERMYLADNATLLSLVRSLPEDVRKPLLVGHNPGLHDLLLDLTHGGGEERLKLQGGFPTATVAVVELQVEQWSAVQADSGKLVQLIPPRELD